MFAPLFWEPVEKMLMYLLGIRGEVFLNFKSETETLPKGSQCFGK